MMKHLAPVIALFLTTVFGLSVDSLLKSQEQASAISPLIGQSKLTEQSGKAISEITLEHIGGFGIGRQYKVILRRDGTALYIGEASAELKGQYRGKISATDFERLAKMLEAHRYFKLRARYARLDKDASTVITSAVRGGRRKTVENYAEAAPTKEIEIAIDAIVKQIKWGK